MERDKIRDVVKEEAEKKRKKNMKKVFNELLQWHQQNEKKKRMKAKMIQRRNDGHERRDAYRFLRSPEGLIMKNRELGLRRSNRTPPISLSDSDRSMREKKFQQDLLYYVSHDRDREGLRVQWLSGAGPRSRAGRSVKAKQQFFKDDFVAHYAYSLDGRSGRVGDRWETRWGELLTVGEGLRRHKEYEKQDDLGCFLFFYQGHPRFCIDATHEPPIPFRSRVGRLINHSRRNPNGDSNSGPNLRVEMIMVNDKPQLIFRAQRDIQEGEFVDYDYGDQSRNGANTWLNAKVRPAMC